MAASIREILKGRAARIIAAMLFTGLMVYLIAKNVSIDTMRACWAELRPLPMFMMFAVYLGVAAARGARFRAVGAGVSLRCATEISLIHSALLRIMPLRSGELAYGVLLKKRGASGLAKSMADMLLLRVLDVSVVLPMAAVVTALLIRNAVLVPLALISIAVGVLFFAIFLFGARFMGKLKGKLDSSSETRGKMLGARMVGILERSFNLSWAKRVELIGFTLLMWLGLFLWFYFALSAVGAVSRFTDGAAAAMMGIVGSMLPLSLIGSFGPMEGGLAGGLIAVGHANSIAFVEAVLISFLTFLCNMAWAAVAWTSFSLDRPDGSPTSRGIAFRRVLGFCLFGIGSAVVLLAKIPYGFETNDQLQYLLLPYREIYAPFLKGDWFTWHTTHYHPFFGYFVRLLHAVAGEDGFATAMFIAHTAVLFNLGVSCLYAARSFKLHAASAAVAVVCVAIVRRYGLGDVVVNHGVLLPADMAMPFLLMGFAAWVEEKPLRAGIFLGVAGLIHANFAVIGPLVLAAPEIWRLTSSRCVRPTLRLVVGFLIFAWPSLVTAFMGFFAADSAPDAIRILFDYRSPHHYKPSIIASKAALWPLVLLLASLPIWLRCLGDGRRRVLQLVLALVISQFIAYVATVWLQNTFVIRLFLWRLSVPLILLSAAAFGEALVSAAKTKRLREVLPAVVSTLLVLSFIDGGPAMQKEWGIDWHKVQRSVTHEGFPTRQTIEGNKRVAPILIWIDRHMPKDAVFLAPPGMDDFRLKARRAVFVDWKCCPMKGEEIAEWARRMNAAMGTKSLPAKGYALHKEGNRRFDRLSLKKLADLAKKEGLTHILAKNKGEVPPNLDKLVTKFGWSVYRVI